MLNRLLSRLSHDVGIDLGTANTLIYVRGKGIVINEPSVVAINTQTKQLLAIGDDARRMVGRTPAHIVAIRPLVDGVVSDFEVTEQMLRHFFRKVHDQGFTLLRRPRVVVGIPSGVTEVERRAVEEATLAAGARAVYLIEEPIAAAIGARLPIQEAAGSFIVDIGGGTTEVAVMSLGGIVASKSLRVAGDELNEAIKDFAREELKLLIGDRMAEEVKLKLGSALPYSDRGEGMPIRGRDLVSGLPKEVVITDDQVRVALRKSLALIIDAVRTTIEETPPELVADIIDHGIVMAGGGALLRRFDQLLASQTTTKVTIADDPLTCVVRGAGVVLEDLDLLRGVLLPSQRV